MVSFGDAHKQLSDLPHRLKVERWPIAGESRADTDTESALSSVRDRRDEIDKRVFALFLDHWRNAPKLS